MKLGRDRAVAIVLFVVATSLARAQTPRPARSLPAFRSDEELRRAIRPFAERYRREAEALKREQEAYERADLLRVSIPPCEAQATAARGRTARADAIIRGHVHDGSRRPLRGAQVRAVGLSLSAVTDSTGVYRIVIPADSLTFPRRVAASAFGLGSDEFERDVGFVQPGDSVDIGFNLCPRGRRWPIDVKDLTHADAIEPPLIPRHDDAEADVVKFHGDHLIVLRRGRLFSIAMDQHGLRLVSTIDAFPVGADSQPGQQEEILTFRDKVIVIGSSQARGGEEISMFRIDSLGQLHYQSTYQIRSDANGHGWAYVPRLVGSKLVLQSSIDVTSEHVDAPFLLPALRRWDIAAGGGEFRPILDARRVFSAESVDPDDHIGLTTISRCELATPVMTCQAYAVLGPRGQMLSVSPRALYMSVSTWRPDGPPRAQSTFYRLPTDGSPPSALNIIGGPLSILESGNYVNVLLYDDREQPPGGQGDRPQLLRIPLGDFGDGTRWASRSAYRALPVRSPPEFEVQARFIDDVLVYGQGAKAGAPGGTGSSLFVIPSRGGAISEVTLPHDIHQIAWMGKDALALGAEGDHLRVSVVRLGREPRVVTHAVLRHQATTFLGAYRVAYQPNGRAPGILGLTGGSTPYRSTPVSDDSVSVAFMRNEGARLVDLGELSAAKSASHVDDRCRWSCPRDWFDNSRPLFHHGRIFALLGYELVEGVYDGDRVREVRRLDFAPRARQP